MTGNGFWQFLGYTRLSFDRRHLSIGEKLTEWHLQANVVQAFSVKATHVLIISSLISQTEYVLTQSISVWLFKMANGMTSQQMETLKNCTALCKHRIVYGVSLITTDSMPVANVSHRLSLPSGVFHVPFWTTILKLTVPRIVLCILSCVHVCCSGNLMLVPLPLVYAVPMKKQFCLPSRPSSTCTALAQRKVHWEEGRGEEGDGEEGREERGVEGRGGERKEGGGLVEEQGRKRGGERKGEWRGGKGRGRKLLHFHVIWHTCSSVT